MVSVTRIYRRWRHLRGYGIHSPAAYRLVTEVIHPGHAYGYYCYDSLPRLRHLNTRLLMRLLTHLRPDSVAIAADDDTERQAIAAVVRLAAPTAGITDSATSAALLIVTTADAVTADGWRHAVFADKRHPALAHRMATATHGHAFIGRRHAIFIDSPAPFQAFDLHL